VKCAKLIPVCHGRLIGLYVDGVLTVRMTQHRGLGSRRVCSNNTKQGKGERVLISHFFDNQQCENLVKQDKFYQTITLLDSINP